MHMFYREMVDHQSLATNKPLQGFKNKSLQQAPDSLVPKTGDFLAGLPEQIDEEHGQHWHTSDGHQRFKNNRQFCAPGQGSPRACGKKALIR